MQATAATEIVANKISTTVNEDVDAFEREKERFASKEDPSQAPVEGDDSLPWESSNPAMTKYIAEIQSLVSKLSDDDNTFIQNPPEGVQFEFDYESNLPAAQRLLEFDPGLSKARFRLVPRKVKEVPFWRNYFYRLSVIRDSYRLMCESEGGSSSDVSYAAAAPPSAAVAARAPPETSASLESTAVSAESVAPSASAGVVVAPSSTSVIDAPKEDSDAFVMVEDPDAFESALEAALNDTDGGHAATMDTADDDLDAELQRRIEEELELLE